MNRNDKEHLIVLKVKELLLFNVSGVGQKWKTILIHNIKTYHYAQPLARLSLATFDYVYKVDEMLVLVREAAL